MQQSGGVGAVQYINDGKLTVFCRLRMLQTFMLAYLFFVCYCCIRAKHLPLPQQPQEAHLHSG